MASIPLRKQTHLHTHAALGQFAVVFQMCDVEFEGENPISTVLRGTVSDLKVSSNSNWSAVGAR